MNGYKVRSWLALVFLTMTVVHGAAAGASSQRPFALVDLTLIDGTGAAPLPRAVVLVSEGRVVSAGAESAVAVPAGYARISLHGAYLLPGFINAHVHTAYDKEKLRFWLRAGVTSVRDLGPQASADFVAARDRLNADRANCRIISATPLITRPGGYGATYVDGPVSARETVRAFIKAGADVIKIAIEDDLQGRTWPILSAAEIEAVVKESHAAGKRVSAHISHVRNLPLAMGAAVDELAHMVVEPLPEATARAIVANRIAWVPTLELWQGVSVKHSLDWDRIAIRNTGIFFRAGGKIALGTDFNGYTTPFDKGFPITEARLLMEAGLSPMDVIVAGTRNAAEVSGRLADLGTIEKGKIADLLVVARDPLLDISELAKAVQVFKSGRPILGGRSRGQRAWPRPDLPPMEGSGLRPRPLPSG